MSGRIILMILGKEWGFLGIGPPPIVWPFMVGLRTVMEPEGMSFSMLMRVNHHWWFNHAYVIELPQKSWMIQYSESSGLVNTCTCSKSGILQIQWAQEVSALEVLPDLGLCASSSALFFFILYGNFHN